MNNIIRTELADEAQQITFEEAINDLQRVATQLNKKNLTEDEYDRHGVFAHYLIKIKFGNWTKALKTAQLKNFNQGYEISDEEIMYDLKKVASIIRSDTISREDYRIYGKYSDLVIQKRYGLWKNALEMAGLSIMPSTYIKDEELLENLREVVKKLGRTPAYEEMHEPLSKYHARTYENRFGNWSVALRKLKLKPVDRKRIPKSLLIKNLQEMAVRLGRPPKTEDIKQSISKYSNGAYIRSFGSWRKAMKEAGFKAKTAKGETNENLIKNIKSVAKKLGHTPATSEMKKPLSKYVVNIYARRFGSWKNALNRAGMNFEYNNKTTTREELINNLREVYNKLGRMPMTKEMKKPLSKHRVKTYIKHFGSWNEAKAIIN